MSNDDHSKPRDDGQPQRHSGPKARGGEQGDHNDDHHEAAQKGVKMDLPEAPTASHGRLIFIGLLAIGMFIVLFLVGWIPRLHQKATLKDDAEKQSEAGVPVAHPRKQKLAPELRLPATLVAWNDTTLYARIDGYVKKRYVDIGDTVAAGQLLAEIDAPDSAQQLAQAQAQVRQSVADLGQSKAKAELDKTNANRSKDLAKNGLISQQDLDTAIATANVSEAAVHSSEAAVNTNEANVRRLADLLAFDKVTAPFAGVISARSIDVGALVTSGNGAMQQLFRITQSDPLRVTVSVPQAFASAIKIGATASVVVKEAQGRAIPGRITRTSGAIDPQTRTMTVEVEVPNADHALLPGTYGEIVFSTAGLQPLLTIPVTGLVFTAAGTQVALVGEDGIVTMAPVQVAQDFGSEMSIASGLKESDLVVIHLDDRSVPGMKVHPVIAPMPSASASPSTVTSSSAGTR